MTKEQFDKLYVGENKVVNCRTEKDVKEFLALADSFGYKWCNGDSYLKIDNYYRYKENTCYLIFSGEYCRKSYFEDLGYEIVVYGNTEKTIYPYWHYELERFAFYDGKPKIEWVLPSKIVINKQKRKTTIVFHDKETNTYETFESVAEKGATLNNYIGVNVALLKWLEPNEYKRYISIGYREYKDNYELQIFFETLVVKNFIDRGFSYNQIQKLVSGNYWENNKIVIVKNGKPYEIEIEVKGAKENKNIKGDKGNGK